MQTRVCKKMQAAREEEGGIARQLSAPTLLRDVACEFVALGLGPRVDVARHPVVVCGR